MAPTMNRRALIGGAGLSTLSVAASAIAATAAPAPAFGISPALAALIADADEKRADRDWHYRHVYKAARGTSRFAAEIATNDALVDAYAIAEDAVALHPVSTALDLDAKMAFIIATDMKQTNDWHQEIAADVRRIVAAGGR